MNDKERKAYRRVLLDAQEEFVQIYRGQSFSYKACKRLAFRIGEVLMKNRKNAKEEDVKYYNRKDVLDILNGKER